MASDFSAAVQLGSSPTMGTPSSSHGFSVARVRVITRLACSSWPVLIQVRPQHTGWAGTSTR